MAVVLILWASAFIAIRAAAHSFTPGPLALIRLVTGALGSTTLAVPAIAVLMSWILLDELPALTAGIGGTVCVIGVLVATSRPRCGAPAGDALRSIDRRPGHSAHLATRVRWAAGEA